MTKKIVSLLLIIIMVFALAACGASKSGFETEDAEETPAAPETVEETETEAESEEETTVDEPYKQGNLTTRFFSSRWMNLRFDVPEDFEMWDQDLIEKDTRSSGGAYITEMYAYKKSDETPSIGVYVKDNSEGKTVEQIAYKQLSALTREPDGLTVEADYKITEDYEFLGESYYLLSLTLYVTSNSSGFESQTDVWELYRLKGDKVINIECLAGKYARGSYSLNDLLKYFKTVKNSESE